MTPSVSEKIWVQQVRKKYKATKSQLPKPVSSIMNQWPKWVDNLWPILHKISHPGLKVTNAKQWTAKDLGQFLGRQSAIARLIQGEVPLSPRVNQERQRSIDSQEVGPGSISDLEIAIRQKAKELKEWRLIQKKVIDETLTSARTRPYPETSDFFEAFGKANIIKPDDLASERTMGVGEKIAVYMIQCWRDISKLESVAQVHKFLSDAAKPAGIEISLKRVEKLCQRIGLKFKGRGRPKGKIQTNPPAAS